jgi:hypothetical protein
MTHPQSAEMDAEFTRLWKKGTPLATIQALLAIGQDRAKAIRVRLDLPARVQGWTPEQDALALKLRAQGMGGTEIGQAVGKSRYSVVGRLWRLSGGKEAPPKPKAPKAPKVARSHVRPPKPGPQNKPGAVFGVLSQSKSDATPERRAEKAAEGQKIIARAEQTAVESPNARSFLKTGLHDCRWPIGEGLSMLSCCNRVQRGSYCAGHARLAYATQEPPEPRRILRAASSLTRHDRVSTPKPKAANDDRLWDQVA